VIKVKHDVSEMCLRYVLLEAWRGSRSTEGSKVIRLEKLDID
jgi:hypothetical protein